MTHGARDIDASICLRSVEVREAVCGCEIVGAEELRAWCETCLVKLAVGSLREGRHAVGVSVAAPRFGTVFVDVFVFGDETTG
jgi:hypothetical protein